jgi:NIPSNAP
MGLGVSGSFHLNTQNPQTKQIPMLKKLTLLLTALVAPLAAAPEAQPAAVDTKTYELRTYFAAEGKLPELHKRFREHTVALFTQHGITNVGYWVPLENKDNKLVYVVSFPSPEAQKKAWKEFGADPEWKKVHAESEKNGKLVAKIESKSMNATAFSPAIQAVIKDPARVFELRTYTTGPGLLPNLHARFKDHTIGLFSKHGMSHFGYWQLQPGKPEAENTLLYLLAHASKEACEKSFLEFRADPVWIAAKAASEKAAGGPLTVADGVKSELLVPTDYSPTK